MEGIEEESHMTYIKQSGRSPSLSVIQCKQKKKTIPNRKEQVGIIGLKKSDSKLSMRFTLDLKTQKD